MRGVESAAPDAADPSAAKVAAAAEEPRAVAVSEGPGSPRSPGVPVVPGVPGAHGRIVMGMNLSGVVDWSTEWPFVDVFKHSREWIPQRADHWVWQTHEPLELTPEGWPLLAQGQAAGTLMLRDISPHYPAGRYVCEYDGDGDIVFGMAARVAHAVPGRIELDVAHDVGGIHLKITRSSRDDPVRNIRVWMPGFEDARSPFHPLFIERLRPFRVLRFMDWQRTNDGAAARWESRTTPCSVRQSTSAGVAIEYMIELANELRADPWFCMPHRADDDFVRRFAEVVRASIHADATIYIEYSNEAWNSLFPVFRHIEALSKERGIHHPEATADEAARVFRIWREVFAESPDRVVRVLAGQLHNPWIAETMAARLAGEFDAIAIGVYFSFTETDAQSFDERTAPEELIDRAMAQWDRHGRDFVRRHAGLAKAWSDRTGRRIQLVAYEGGQHFTAWGRDDLPYLNAMRDAQTHPRMMEAYRRVLSDWIDAGGGLFCAFSSTGGWGKWGYWGHLEHQDQPLHEAPRHRVLLEHALPREPQDQEPVIRRFGGIAHAPES